MAINMIGPQSVTPIPGRDSGFSLSSLLANPKAQMAGLTLGNMLMQANPRTQRMGTSMMQGGSALIQLQLDEEEKAAAARAANEKSLKETLFGLAEKGITDKDMWTLALEEHNIDPSGPRAKKWLNRATSEEEKQRNQAIAVLGEHGAALFDQTKLPLSDLLDLKSDYRQDQQMEQEERHHQDSLAVRQGQLDVSRGNLELDREEAERDRAVSDMLMSELAAMGATGAPPASTVSAGPEGGQVVPVGQGQVSPAGTLPPLGTERVGRTAEGRPIIKNPDGSHSTERSITGPWGPNGEWVNIPSMFGGKQVSEEEAVRIMRANNFVDPETGRKMPFFPTQEAAIAAAQERSGGTLREYGGGAPSAGGMTGLPMVDSTLRIGSIMAAMGDTGRANYFASMARLLADKSPGGRQADIEQKVQERVATEAARVLTTDELLKIVGPDGKSFPPGTTVGDLAQLGEAIRPRPTQAIPADRQDKLLGGINNLMFVEKQLDAVRKGVKTGLSPTAGPLSWAKSYLGFENEAQFRAAQEQAATAAQALITGIPSNFDAQRFERLIIGFLDHPAMIKQKAMWQVNLTKQMLRTTLAYYKGSNYILPDELINSAKKLGVDVNSVTSFTKEDQKLMEMGDKMEKQISLGEEKDSSSRAEEAEKYLRKYGIQ